MKDIAIYGAGGLGREIVALIDAINRHAPNTYRLIGFFDDGKQKGESISHFGKVLGGIKEVNVWETPLCVALGMGSPLHLYHIANSIDNPNIEFPNLIWPGFWVGDTVTFKIGRGNIIQGGCAVTTNVSIGDFNVLNGDVVMGHDVSVGDYNVFMPDVRISGQVSIGNQNLFGVRSLVLQGILIGNNVTIGPGAVQLTKPKDGGTYLGNPAKRFRY